MSGASESVAAHLLTALVVSVYLHILFQANRLALVCLSADERRLLFWLLFGRKSGFTFRFYEWKSAIWSVAALFHLFTTKSSFFSSLPLSSLIRSIIALLVYNLISGFC